MNMKDILLPHSDKAITLFNCYQSGIGYVDFKPLRNFTNRNLSRLRIENNNMSATDVNHILVDFDAMSVSGYTGRIINIDGTNSAPDSTSGGYDGLTAKANLIAKGFSVETN